MTTIFKSKTEKRNGYTGFYLKKVDNNGCVFDCAFHSHSANCVGLRDYNEELHEIPGNIEMFEEEKYEVSANGYAYSVK